MEYIFIKTIASRTTVPLVLDEPATYLDPQSKEILQNALMSFSGTLLMVTHDPQFASSIDATKVLLLPEEKFQFYSDEYLARVRDLQPIAAGVRPLCVEWQFPRNKGLLSAPVIVWVFDTARLIKYYDSSVN